MQTRFVVAALAGASIVTATAAAATTAAQTVPPRPKITSISHMAVYTSDAAAAEHFYTVVVGAAKLPDPENPRGVRYALSATQFIEVLPLPADAGIRRMDHTAWNTESAEGMRKYLAAKGWKVPARVERGADGSRWFEVLDPEGNKVQFVEPPAHPKPVNAPNVIGDQIIHFGFRVQSREAEDAFYRGLLGFKPYWWGGMKEGEVNWVAQQCPDGHQWLEYMIESKPDNGAPATTTRRSLGGVDHLSIGEVSVPDAYQVLVKGNRLEGIHDTAPKIGGDGKYQFNLFDPDATRIELMDFHATVKPSWSPFTEEDPSE